MNPRRKNRNRCVSGVCKIVALGFSAALKPPLPNRSSAQVLWSGWTGAQARSWGGQPSHLNR